MDYTVCQLTHLSVPDQWVTTIKKYMMSISFGLTAEFSQNYGVICASYVFLVYTNSLFLSFLPWFELGKHKYHALTQPFFLGIYLILDRFSGFFLNVHLHQHKTALWNTSLGLKSLYFYQENIKTIIVMHWRW